MTVQKINEKQLRRDGTKITEIELSNGYKVQFNDRGFGKFTIRSIHPGHWPDRTRKVTYETVKDLIQMACVLEHKNYSCLDWFEGDYVEWEMP